MSNLSKHRTMRNPTEWTTKRLVDELLQAALFGGRSNAEVLREAAKRLTRHEEAVRLRLKDRDDTKARDKVIP